MWFGNKGNDNDVAVSTRVRIARNLSGYPFPGRLSAEQEKEICSRVAAIYKGKEWKINDLSKLSKAERESLADKHIISRELAEKEGMSEYISNKAGDVNIMLLEEDHVRIQAIEPGFNVKTAMEKAYKAEEILDKNAEIAYSEKYGYLTHCPTNLGTAIRISVMLHLPSYTKAGQIRELALQLAKLGLTIRGEDGEGSSASAYLYQISNQITLGVSEDEIVERIEKIIGQIIEGERSMHEKLAESSKSAIRESARRKYGMLMYSESISSKELTSYYSDLRLAAASGLIKLPVEKLDELMIRSKPYTIEAEHKNTSSPEERDRARAALVREIIGNAEI